MSNLNSKSKLGSSALHLAIIENNMVEVNRLITKPENLLVLNNNKDSVLYYAANNPRILRLLINSMPENYRIEMINHLNEIGCTPLHRAVICKSKEAIELLLNNGAEINILDNEGNAPLHYAIESQNQEIIELLCRYQANVELKKEDKLSPLEQAKALRNEDIYALLNSFVISTPPEEEIDNSAHNQVITISEGEGDEVEYLEQIPSLNTEGYYYEHSTTGVDPFLIRIMEFHTSNTRIIQTISEINQFPTGSSFSFAMHTPYSHTSNIGSSNEGRENRHYDNSNLRSRTYSEQFSRGNRDNIRREDKDNKRQKKEDRGFQK